MVDTPFYLDIGHNLQGNSCQVEGVHCKIHQIPPIMDVFSESTIPHFLYLPPDETWRMEAIIFLYQGSVENHNRSPPNEQRWDSWMNELDLVEKTFLTFLSLATPSPNLEFVKPRMLFMFLGTPHFYFSNINHNLSLMFPTLLLTISLLPPFSFYPWYHSFHFHATRVLVPVL